LDAGCWSISSQVYIDTFGASVCCSLQFIRELKNLSKASTLTWDVALASLRDAQQKRLAEDAEKVDALPKSKKWKPRRWRPQDVKQAARQLGVSMDSKSGKATGARKDAVQAEEVNGGQPVTSAAPAAQCPVAEAGDCVHSKRPSEAESVDRQHAANPPAIAVEHAEAKSVAAATAQAVVDAFLVQSQDAAGQRELNHGDRDAESDHFDAEDNYYAGAADTNYSEDDENDSEDQDENTLKIGRRAPTPAPWESTTRLSASSALSPYLIDNIRVGRGKHTRSLSDVNWNTGHAVRPSNIAQDVAEPDAVHDIGHCSDLNSPMNDHGAPQDPHDHYASDFKGDTLDSTTAESTFQLKVPGSAKPMLPHPSSPLPVQSLAPTSGAKLQPSSDLHSEKE
jgi:hypothetical protein